MDLSLQIFPIQALGHCDILFTIATGNFESQFRPGIHFHGDSVSRSTDVKFVEYALLSKDFKSEEISRDWKDSHAKKISRAALFSWTFFLVGAEQLSLRLAGRQLLSIPEESSGTSTSSRFLNPLYYRNRTATGLVDQHEEVGYRGKPYDRVLASELLAGKGDRPAG
jgi:hypothetical protein